MRIDIYTKFVMTLMAIGLLLIGLKGFVTPSVADSHKHDWQITAACYAMELRGYSDCYVWALNKGTGMIKTFVAPARKVTGGIGAEWTVYD